jgi:hypothetical protein
LVDEKDLEIARLKGQLEATQAAQARQARRDGPVTGTFRVLGALALAAAVGLGALVAIGSLIPDKTPEERAAEIERTCKRRVGHLPDNVYNECVMREMIADAER